MKKSRFIPVLAFIFLAFTACTSIAQTWSYPNCPDVSPDDFRRVILVDKHSIGNDNDMLEPLKLAFDMDDQGNVNIFYIRRHGSVNLYDAVTKQVTEIAKLNPGTKNEDGLVGIVLDPNFKTNGWMYLMYSKDEDFRISRFNYDAGNKILDLNSELIILAIPSSRDRWHTGGAMQFDAYGDLWIAVGDNEAAQRGPSNTADLRGGILRIHPHEDGSYSIPEGNYWEFAVDYFTKAGDAVTAAEYQDPDKVKRETYAKGMRNAYTLTLDPVRRWATYGDCGPDITPRGSTNPADFTEEHNVVVEPGFFGWPYFSANQHVQTAIPPKSYNEADENKWDKNKVEAANPFNDNPSISGVRKLTPAISATHPYGHDCAMTGPIYRYDPDLQSDIKFPPHFNRIWFVADWNKSWVNAIELDPQGREIIRNERMWDNFTSMPLDIQMGPDGAIYSVNYSNGPWRQLNSGTSISRIEYTGPECDAAADFAMEKAGCTNPLYDEYDLSIPIEYSDSSACINLKTNVKIDAITGGIVMENLNIAITQKGAHTIRMVDVRGKEVFFAAGTDNRKYTLPRAGKSGIYFVKVTTSKGTLNQKLMLY